MDTTDQSFDMTGTLQRFPGQLTRMEDWAQQHFALGAPVDTADL